MNKQQQLSMKERLDQLERILAARPMSRMELHKATGWSRSCVWLYTKALHEKNRIYVYSYVKSGSNDVEIYAAGNKPDAEKPFRGDELEEVEEIEVIRAPVVVNVRRDPYLWLSAGRALA